MAETVKYQKPVAEHVTHVTFSLSLFFEANTKMVFLKKSCFLQ